MAKNFVTLYPDLVDGTDLVGQQLVAELHTFFNLAVPSSLRAATMPQRAPRGSFWRSLPRWPRTAVVGLLAVFTLVGATYVVFPLLQQLWAADRGLARVASAGLARDLDVAQTIGGVTVRLQRGYADANRVAVGYTVEFPKSVAAEGTPMVGVATLTDANGRRYHGLESMFAGASPVGAQVLNFETPDGLTAAHDNTFTLSIAKVFAGGPSASPKESFSGPWVFTFTLASAAGRVVEPSLTVTSGDLRLTFTRSVVAPSATRLDYRITRTGGSDGITGSVVLIVGGRTLPAAGFCQRSGECFLMTTEPLLDLETLTIDEVIILPDLPGASEGNPQQVHLKGPFVLQLRT